MTSPDLKRMWSAARLLPEPGCDVVRELIDRCRAAEAERDATYCAYCGKRYPLDNEAADAVSEHIRTCERHPMRAVEAERDEARRIAIAFADRYASQPGDWTDEDESHEVGDLGLLYHGQLRRWAKDGE